MLLPSLLFLVERRGRDVELGGALWWFLYLIGLSLLSWLGASSSQPLLSQPQQLLLVDCFALAIVPLAVRSTAGALAARLDHA